MEEPNWEFPNMRGSDIDPPIVELLSQGHAQKGAPIYRNCRLDPF